MNVTSSPQLDAAFQNFKKDSCGLVSKSTIAEWLTANNLNTNAVQHVVNTMPSDHINHQDFITTVLKFIPPDSPLASPAIPQRQTLSPSDNELSDTPSSPESTCTMPSLKFSETLHTPPHSPRTPVLPSSTRSTRSTRSNSDKNAALQEVLVEYEKLRTEFHQQFLLLQEYRRKVLNGRKSVDATRGNGDRNLVYEFSKLKEELLVVTRQKDSLQKQVIELENKASARERQSYVVQCMEVCVKEQFQHFLNQQEVFKRKESLRQLVLTGCCFLIVIVIVILLKKDKVVHYFA
ncbi:hypothetical protein P9112_012067 [Eukaryota sp. TZLM1-RC]